MTMKIKTRRGPFLTLTLLVTGCATSTAAKPKLEVHYQSSTSLADSGSNIDGKLCFNATHWDVSAPTNANDTVDLRADGRHYVIGPSSPTEHRLVGDHRGRGGSDTIDLRFGLDHLAGRVGWREFDTQRNGDHLEGTYKKRDMSPVKVRIFGLDALWALPLAEQAVLLPSLLFCANNSPTHDFDIDLRDLQHSP
jgi:hypothetical protein